MIAVTGAAGFIGSCMVRSLNDAGYTDLVVVDEFSRPDKMRNLDGKSFREQIHRDNFLRWLERHHADVEAVLHLGARTDTTEMDTAIFDRLNLEYSKSLWMLCAGFRIPLFYASSAATYGLGEQGYADDHATIPLLKPLNPYGQSKQDFDVWALEQQHNAQTPPAWAGFKFFNVYGPGERHKGRMASVVLQAFDQIVRPSFIGIRLSTMKEYERAVKKWERYTENPKITVHYNRNVKEVLGSDGVSGLLLEDTTGGPDETLAVTGMFLAIGHEPNSKPFVGKLDMDEAGYIKIGRPGSTYTSVHGVFVCGDVADKVYRQAVTAAGTGCMAAIDAERWLAEQ